MQCADTTLWALGHSDSVMLLTLRSLVREAGLRSEPRCSLSTLHGPTPTPKRRYCLARSNRPCWRAVRQSDGSLPEQIVGESLDAAKGLISRHKPHNQVHSQHGQETAGQKRQEVSHFILSSCFTALTALHPLHLLAVKQLIEPLLLDQVFMATALDDLALVHD